MNERRNMVAHSFWYFLVVLGFGCLVESTTVGIQLDEAGKVCGIFEAASLNSAAIRQGDFLLRRRESFDTVNRYDGVNEHGVVRFGDVWQRVVFDHDAKEYCVLTIRESIETNLANVETPAGPERKTVVRSAVCIDADGVLLSRLFPGGSKTRHLAAKPTDKLFAEKAIGFPDYRSFGLFFGGVPGSFQRMMQMTNRLKTGSEFHESKELGDDKLMITMRSEPNSESWIVEEYTFDTARLVPILVNKFLQNKAQIEDQRPSFIGKQSFEWKELNGIQLPKSGNADTPYREMINGHYQSAHRFTDVEFHWFSVNERIDPKWFDGSQFADFASFKELLDAKACGAVDLLETDK